MNPKMKSNVYVASICVNRKRIYLGRFRTEIQAAKAYQAAAKKYHGAFAGLD